MITLFQVIVLVLLLLSISFATPKLHPLLYIAIFSYFLLYFLTTIVFPFGLRIISLFDAIPEPFSKLLVGSAIILFISEVIAQQLKEAGYGSLSTISHFAIKISILTMWLQYTSTIIEFLSTLIKN